MQNAKTYTLALLILSRALYGIVMQNPSLNLNYIEFYVFSNRFATNFYSPTLVVIPLKEQHP